MKSLSPVLGLSLFVLSGIIAPLGAQGKPLVESSPNLESPLPESSPAPQMSERIAVYRDCIDAHARIHGAEFKQVNKFCSCVADQTIQGGGGGLSDCAVAKSGVGKTLGMLGEAAPSVITGLMEGLSSQSSSSQGNDLLGRLGGLLGSGGSGFNLQDLLKNKF